MIQPTSVGLHCDVNEQDFLPARMLNEFTYCPRLFYLEHVEGLFVHNLDTLEGEQVHKRVDGKTDKLPPADSKDPDERIHSRSVSLASEKHGIMAKLDLVEISGNVATPVDYKKGAPFKKEDGTLDAWDPERVQMCVQALVLRENGYECHEAILYFRETRQRVTIAIDDALVEQTLQTIENARTTMKRQIMPLPLVDSPKCARCSLVSVCLPDESSCCARTEEIAPVDDPQLYLFDIGPTFQYRSSKDRQGSLERQLITARDERKPLYLNTQGNTVGISGEVLKVKEKTKVIQEVRLKDINQVNLFGAIQVTTQAIQGLLAADIPLIYFSFGGWFHGMTQPVGLKNIFWRREQFRMADRSDFCLYLAKSLVSGKVKNCRTLLMRNHIAPPETTLRFLKGLERDIAQASNIGELLGVEGLAARTYFQEFSGMIKTDEQEDVPTADSENTWKFDFARRNRRPPRDPINALLSLGYSVLAKDLTIAIASTGLDPYLGYYHQPRFGRPSLALDLMEPFRPLIVDSAVLSAVNQRMVTERDFIAAGDSVALTPSGRKGFFRAYEARMDQLVTHPLFGYRVSYRRLLEIQVRLLARVLLGELREYPVFITR